MKERFVDILTIGGKTNSLGRTGEVIALVLGDTRRLTELYDCLFDEDAWVRMRAADSLEKICRQYPDWLLPYIDNLQRDFVTNTQPSIQWHLAQIYSQVDLSPEQMRNAISWLKNILSTTDVDWIVSANAMQVLVQFTKVGVVPVQVTSQLLRVQQNHASKSVIKRANKLLIDLE